MVCYQPALFFIWLAARDGARQEDTERPAPVSLPCQCKKIKRRETKKSTKDSAPPDQRRHAPCHTITPIGIKHLWFADSAMITTTDQCHPLLSQHETCKPVDIAEILVTTSHIRWLLRQRVETCR